MTTVLCEIADCAYYEFHAEEGQAYQQQCGNDEIEIGHDGSMARCYSYEKETETESEDESD